MSASYITPYARIFFEQICKDLPATVRVLRQLYPDGAKCASCAAPITGKRALKTFWRGERTYCSSCETKFSPSAGTILAGAHLTYAQFEVLCVLISLGVDRKRIATMAGVREETVQVWEMKVRYWETHGV